MYWHVPEIHGCSYRLVSKYYPGERQSFDWWNYSSKNEIQIITLPDELWRHWQAFLTKYTTSELIDPFTFAQFKDIKGFKIKTMSLKREFFKHCGHFTDNDFGTFA